MTPASPHARYLALFGRGFQADLAAALDTSPAVISAQFRCGRVRPGVVACLEWLEACDPDWWPERWAKLRVRRIRMMGGVK